MHSSDSYEQLLSETEIKEADFYAIATNIKAILAGTKHISHLKKERTSVRRGGENEENIWISLCEQRGQSLQGMSFNEAG